MKHMADFLEGIQWWRLAPAPSALQAQPSAYLSKRAFARSSNGDLGVAYAPDANAITLSMSTFGGTMQARWFNPQTGAYTAVSGSFANTGSRSFTPPSGGDWVLHLFPAPSTGTFSVAVQSVSSGRAYAVTAAQTGAVYYIDRSYTISSLSAGLSGGRLIRTANDDKALTAPSHLTFTVSAAATVYVGYDKRGGAPSWLSGWTATSDSLVLSDAPASPMRVYSKSFAAGGVTLGGNLAAGASGALSHYVVIAKASGGTTASPGPLAASAPEDAWEHEGDADGDGLLDAFEAAAFTDPGNADSDGDGNPDETELDGRGRTLWEAQEAGEPIGGTGACGLLGAELAALLALLGFRRKRSA
jgi:hypothetical protein